MMRLPTIDVYIKIINLGAMTWSLLTGFSLGVIFQVSFGISSLILRVLVQILRVPLPHKIKLHVLIIFQPNKVEIITNIKISNN